MKQESLLGAGEKESGTNDSDWRILAEQVGREVLESRLEPGTWAKALYQSGSKHREALAIYTRLRLDDLASAQREKKAKSHSFQSRRLNKCMGNWKARESFLREYQAVAHDLGTLSPPQVETERNASSRVLLTARHGPPLNFVKVRVPVVWIWILFIGTSSSLALLGRLALPSLTGVLAHSLTMVAVLVAALVVWAALSVRQVLTTEWVVLGWKPMLTFCCNLVCITSALLSAKVISQSVSEDFSALRGAEVSEAPAAGNPGFEALGKSPELVSSKLGAFSEER